LDTRLDTPPSINRRHPDSGLAHRALGVGDLGSCVRSDRCAGRLFDTAV